MKDKLYQSPEVEVIKIESDERILAGGSGGTDPLDPEDG
jgi:hypothetical protein